MEIRQANSSDLPRIMEIYEIARNYQKEHGNPTQWGDSYPQEELIRTDLAQGFSYVLEESGRVVGTFALIEGEEPTYQIIEGGSWISDGPYATVHRVAGDGTVKGLGSAVLDWAFGKYGHIRIDTHKDNLIMQHVIEKNGFTYCGTIYVEDGSPRLAYERSAVRKAILIGNRERFEKFYPNTEFADSVEKIYLTMEEAGQALSGLHGQDSSMNAAQGRLMEARDAQFLAADAIARVPESLIAQLPDLKIIHSEGVAYNGIDCEAAAKRGIYVCNNRGVNADAVAEQTILLMLGLLRSVTAGDRAVRAGEQIQRKESMMVNGITELGECRIGLIGFGDIAKAVAKRLEPFGCEVFYNAAHRKSAEDEAKYHVNWMERQKMLSVCDIISIHVPVTPDTAGMVDEAFLRAMRPNALLINTARGEIVDNEALGRALNEGWIAGAGLDTVAPEPVAADHPLLQLSAEAESRLLFSPHIGGVTTGVFRKGHRNIWTAFERVSRGERPANIVNGL